MGHVEAVAGGDDRGSTGRHGNAGEEEEEEKEGSNDYIGPLEGDETSHGLVQIDL